MGDVAGEQCVSPCALSVYVCVLPACTASLQPTALSQRLTLAPPLSLTKPAINLPSICVFQTIHKNTHHRLCQGCALLHTQTTPTHTHSYDFQTQPPAKHSAHTTLCLVHLSAHTTGSVKDVQLSGPATDQMALVEFASPAEAATALNLNGMKIGDSHTLQVGFCHQARPISRF